MYDECSGFKVLGGCLKAESDRVPCVSLISLILLYVVTALCSS